MNGDLPRPGVQLDQVYQGYGKALSFADIKIANGECSSRRQAEFVECAECHEKVGIHCDKCNIQVTGCTCTDSIIHGRDYALKARATRPSHGAGMNRAQRRQAARKRSPALWTPDQIHK